MSVKFDEKSRFPNARLAGPDGLLCYGGDLDSDTLLDAYSHGIFPWPQMGLPLLWFSPPERGVIDFSDLHWPRRFLRELRGEKFEITFNQAFRRVILECASVPRTTETGTWILPEMVEAYTRLHELGYAHSVECWAKGGQGGELAGGLYGVYIGGVFSGESMFFKESNASKYCLHSLLEVLKRSGLTWMDIQMVTPVLKSIGGKYISRDELLARIQKAQVKPCELIWSKDGPSG